MNQLTIVPRVESPQTEALAKIIPSLTTAERQEMINAIGDQIKMLQLRHVPGEIEHLAFSLAWESLQVAWHGLSGNLGWCMDHQEHIDGAAQKLAEALFPPMQPEFDTASGYPSQFCDCGCTNEFGDKTGVPCMADDLPLYSPEWLEAA